jgi:hypothetical protein
MAITLTGATGLFTLLGKGFNILNALNIARLTTVETEHAALITAYEAVTVDLNLERAFRGPENALLGWQDAGDGYSSAIISALTNYFIETVDADKKLGTKDIDSAIRELIRQMDTGAISSTAAPQTVEDAAVSSTQFVSTPENTVLTDSSNQITQANPAVVTTAVAHGLAIGDVIGLSGIAGMVEVNEKSFVVGTVPLTTTFTLQGIDSTLYTAHSAATAGLVHKNNGDGGIVVSTKLGNGRVCEYALSETITAEVVGDATAGSESISLNGEEAEANKLSYRWPKGSGGSASITAVTASGFSNASFEDVDDRTDTPDEWVTRALDPTNEIAITTVEVQTVAISASPTGGTYQLQYTRSVNLTEITAPIAWNATSGAVQSALRNLAGLENITVDSGATSSPNFTHTITFTGVAGDVSILQSEEAFDGGTGTITILQVTAGTANAYTGNTVQLLGAGSPVGALLQLVELEPETQYLFSCKLRQTVAFDSPSLFSLFMLDGTTGNTSNNQAMLDSEGTANELAVDIKAAGDLVPLSTWLTVTATFRTPRVLPDRVYVGFGITVIGTNGNIFIDHCALQEMTQLYAGGPSIAAFSGKTRFGPRDAWNIAITNDRGQPATDHEHFQEWFDRAFDMSGLGLMLPSNSSPTIADTLIT